jgi:hypothetical protein
MWEPRYLTTLWAFTAVTGIALPFTFYNLYMHKPNACSGILILSLREAVVIVTGRTLQAALREVLMLQLAVQSWSLLETNFH